MVKDLSNGVVVESTLVSISKTKSMASVSFRGLMVANTKVNGRIVFKMVKDAIFHRQEKVEMEFGRMEKE